MWVSDSCLTPTQHASHYTTDVICYMRGDILHYTTDGICYIWGVTFYITPPMSFVIYEGWHFTHRWKTLANIISIKGKICAHKISLTSRSQEYEWSSIFPLYLRFYYYIWELFRQCGILLFLKFYSCVEILIHQNCHTSNDGV